ncbi:ABC transporter permease [Labrys monachus]|uniref:Peptide/nickel transport system permease protein n=1 Tax=Labrys monachus TaxID=217067 RepID=A0ABU0FL46_9HYPH|nr:ABC transporter permease [Labrys monachus]MDQ0394818.1 peptide/nickel transport system permease protein [Labrys monachus]
MIYLRYTIARLLHAVPVVIGVTLFCFLAIQFVPGDPIRIMMHGHVSDAEVAKIYAQLGMDRPLAVQYAGFLARAAVGDLGQSIIQHAPVVELIVEKLAPTLWLLGTGTLLSILVALPVALIVAARPDRPVDHIVRAASMIGFAMPPFWIGLLLILGFGIGLGWLPISGYGEGGLDHLRHMILPGLTIAFFLTPILVQSLRASMLDVLATDHIEVARARGLPEWRILCKHVLRNALIPTLTVLAVNISWLVSGAVVVESVFALPGLGSLLIRSVGYRDYPLIQGLALVFAVIVVVVNLLADLSYALVDRRVMRG